LTENHGIGRRLKADTQTQPVLATGRASITTWEAICLTDGSRQACLSRRDLFALTKDLELLKITNIPRLASSVGFFVAADAYSPIFFSEYSSRLLVTALCELQFLLSDTLCFEAKQNLSLAAESPGAGLAEPGCDRCQTTLPKTCS
jgi:hypothetical protein